MTARPPHSKRVPVVENLGLAGAEERDHADGISIGIEPRRITIHEDDVARQPVRIIATARECPLACQTVAVLNRNRLPWREPTSRYKSSWIGEHLRRTLITNDLA